MSAVGCDHNQVLFCSNFTPFCAQVKLAKVHQLEVLTWVTSLEIGARWAASTFVMAHLNIVTTMHHLIGLMLALISEAQTLRMTGKRHITMDLSLSTA